ncbi:Cj0069 family protein [Bradyrhizobium japonicum]|uniref:Cj0069 family protein n=1 Tax=Bradyrhizobium japonicum TaxID=375 RepID=UPI0035D5AD8A
MSSNLASRRARWTCHPSLEKLMEDEWTPQLTSLLDIARDDLPAIWDADFMLGPVQTDGSDSYVLGEINVSSVHPYPNEAPAEIAGRVADRLQLKL